MEETEDNLNIVRHCSSKCCDICDEEMVEPYVKCAECRTQPPVSLCLSCFVKGLEIADHKSDHSYEIVRSDFSLWSCSWTGADELKLLTAVEDSGLGNWCDVAKETGRSAVECESHYTENYVHFPQLELPKLDGKVAVANLTPFASKVSDDPPRPAFDSRLHLDMAGYSAARGEFVAEFNNYAEMLLKDVDFDGDQESKGNELDKNLKFAKLDIYSNCLRERARRKRIIRDCGLISVLKASSSWQRYDTVTRNNKGLPFTKLMRLLPAEEFDAFMESMQYQCELEHKVKCLQEFRVCGLQQFSSAIVYQRLNVRREARRAPCQNHSALSDVLLQLELHSEQGRDFISSLWKQGKNTDCGVASNISPHSPRFGANSRRTAPPLDITGLPGYDKLNAKETQLCSQVRLVPDAYLEFKAMLLNECHRNGGHLRLAQARQLIKIDVNKTRKLYDFLVGEGLL